MTTTAEKRPKKEIAILSRHDHRTGMTQRFDVRVMARAEGWAMVRRKGAMPFIVRESEFEPVEAVK